MRVSYLKTQWWRFLLCLVCLGIAIFCALQPAADSSTVEGLNENLGNMFASACWFGSSMIWGIMSFVNWHEDCIRELDKKNRELEERVYALEHRAITDIEEKSPNHFIVRRKLGPDKNT